MSLEQLTSTHQVQVQRLVAVRDDTLGWSERWTTVRAAECRIQPIGLRETAQLGRLGYEATHILYFAADPQVDERTRILFGQRIFDDLRPRNVDELDRLWIVTARETTP